jgi:hypothetical protein
MPVSFRFFFALSDSLRIVFHAKWIANARASATSDKRMIVAGNVKVFHVATLLSARRPPPAPSPRTPIDSEVRDRARGCDDAARAGIADRSR